MFSCGCKPMPHSTAVTVVELLEEQPFAKPGVGFEACAPTCLTCLPQLDFERPRPSRRVRPRNNSVSRGPLIPRWCRALSASACPRGIK
jgi:hypothetical protein